MSTYDVTVYGTDYYGYRPPPPPPTPAPVPPPSEIPAGYCVEPFNATSINYRNIMLTWQQPWATDPFLNFRILRNRFGFPVDEDDGEVLEDSNGPTYPGSAFLDTGVIEGTYHYYACYILITLNDVEIWYRAGLAACLAPNSQYNSAAELLSHIPEYYKNVQDGELTTDSIGNPYISQFMDVFGWGLDYLKTCLEIASNVYNPTVIPMDYLFNLSSTIGMSLEPEIRAGVLRGAIANNANLTKQRGTLTGIEAQIEQLTGWGADLTVGYNLMLEDDQATFINPQPAPYDPYTYYQVDDIVTYTTSVDVPAPTVCTFKCTTPHCGNTPDDDSYWTQMSYEPTINNTLLNSRTGWQNTWEPRYLNTSYSRLEGSEDTSLYNQEVDPWGQWSHFTDDTSCREWCGCKQPDCPPAAPVQTENVITITNTVETTTTVEVRNVSRTTEDITLMNGDPDPLQVIADGVPVPYIIQQQTWGITTEYRTGDMVFWNSQPFLALKASTGITPPTNNIPNNEWQPIGLDERVALMLSGYASQDLSDLSNAQAAITPYVTWYDEYGKPIVKLLPRSGSDQYQDVHCATTGTLGCTATSTTVLTSTTDGPLTVDTHPCALNDRVCVKDQSDHKQNGYYYISQLGVGGSSPWKLTRCC